MGIGYNPNTLYRQIFGVHDKGRGKEKCFNVSLSQEDHPTQNRSSLPHIFPSLLRPVNHGWRYYVH